MSDRYDGNGDPIWHDHFWPEGADYDRDDSTFRFDALEFSDGRFAVWMARSKHVVDYHPDREAAERAAQTFANDEYSKSLE